MIFVRLDFAPLARFGSDLPTYLELSLTLPVVSLRYLPKKLTAFFQNKSKRGTWKMDETKEEESMHSGKLPLNWRVRHLYGLKQSKLSLDLTCTLFLSVP